MSTRLMQASIPPFVFQIAGGPNHTNSISFESFCFDAEGITVQAPAALDPNNYWWEISQDNGVTWAQLQDETSTLIAVPAAGKAIAFNGIFFAIQLLRMATDNTTNAIRSFQVIKSFRG